MSTFSTVSAAEFAGLIQSRSQYSKIVFVSRFGVKIIDTINLNQCSPLQFSPETISMIVKAQGTLTENQNVCLYEGGKISIHTTIIE